MIRLTRPPKPAILVQNEAVWTAAFFASADPRPNKRHYAHKDVLDALDAMSGGKCFYCESRLVSGGTEVEHYVEISVDRSLAYDWENLYSGSLRR